jgi:hypothetical protein
VAGDLEIALDPMQVSALIAYAMRFRSGSSEFDVVQLGETAGLNQALDLEIVTPYALAGATWWLESMFPRRTELKQARARIRQGPPRL